MIPSEADFFRGVLSSSPVEISVAFAFLSKGGVTAKMTNCLPNSDKTAVRLHNIWFPISFYHKQV